MKPIIIILSILILLCSKASAQKLSMDRTLHIKTLDTNSVDFSMEIKSKLSLSKTDSISMDFGYGALIGGNNHGFFTPTSSIGPLGSGIANSPFFLGLAKLGPQYYTGRNVLGWGKSGLNFALSGNLGKMSLSGIYSGFNDTYAFSFQGSAGTFTGRGTIISSEGKLEGLQSDIQVKF